MKSLPRVHVTVEKDTKEAPKTALEDKLARFGSADRIKIYRHTDADPESYVGVLAASDDMIASLEEVLAERFGGGRYHVKGFVKGACVAGVTVVIDPKIFPPKQSEPERRRAEEMHGAPFAAPPAQQPLTLAQLEQYLAARERRPASSENALLQHLTARGDKLETMLFETLRQRQEPTAPLEALARTIDQAKRLGVPFGNAPGNQPADDMTPGQRIGLGAVGTFLDRVATRTGDALATKVSREILDDSPASTTSTPPASTTSAPPASTTSAPPRTSPPRGAKPLMRLTPEELAAVRERRGAAPTVRDAFPKKGP